MGSIHDTKALKSDIDHLNICAVDTDSTMQFTIYQRKSELYIRVFNRYTRQLMRTIPLDDFRDSKHRFQMAVGMRVNDIAL